MTVTITGSTLTIDELVRVARGGEDVALDPAAIGEMRRARDVVEKVLEHGDTVYGLNTGLGVLKREKIATDVEDQFNRRLLEFHRIGQGPAAPVDVARGALVRLVNHFALGTVGVRPELADRLIEALNTGVEPQVRILGLDLMFLADLALDSLGDFSLAPNEGLAMLDNASLKTSFAALAVMDAEALTAALDAAAALSLEGFGANLAILHPFAVKIRLHQGASDSADRMRRLLEGAFLWNPGSARNLQDPLCYRCVPHINGALRECLEYVKNQVTVELNSGQGNPIVVVEESRLLSVGNFEMQALVAALDFLRISLATALTASQERSVKLLDSLWSGLPTGLLKEGGGGESGLAMYQILAFGLTGEARQLAQPVSFEIPSTSGAEGIEDRWNFGVLAARKLAEMIRLGELIVAIELLVAAQAVELRAKMPAGRGTREITRLVRESIPLAAEGDVTPSDLSGLVALIRSGVLARV